LAGCDCRACGRSRLRCAQEGFNREFDALVNRKHDTIGKIDERRERLAQILAELTVRAVVCAG
jgi:hypothetical protein